MKSFLSGVETVKKSLGFEGYPDGLTQSKNLYYFLDGMGNNDSDFTVGQQCLKQEWGIFLSAKSAD